MTSLHALCTIPDRSTQLTAIAPNMSTGPILSFAHGWLHHQNQHPLPQVQTNIINTNVTTTPTTPDTPDPCYLELTSSASSASPQAQGEYTFLLKNTNIAFTGKVLQKEEMHW